MKHRILKKITAVICAVLMLASLPLGVSAAASAVVPVVFIPDMTEIILYQNPNTITESEIFNFNSDDFTKYVTDMLIGFVMAAEDVSVGTDKINGVIEKIFYSIQCDENGNSKNLKLGPHKYTSPVYYNKDESKGIYSENIAAFAAAADGKVTEKDIFVFTYDWRVSPADNASLLKSYIETVESNMNAKRVSVVAGGYGSVVANAYLYLYEEHAKDNLKSCVFLDSFATGSSLIGDVMSGDLVVTVSDAIKDADTIGDLIGIYDVLRGNDVGDAFMRYMSADPLGLVSNAFRGFIGNSSLSSLAAIFSLTLAAYIMSDQGLFATFGSGYKEIMVKADNYIYSGGLREYLRNIPGLWAVVPSDSYNEAISFMFGSKKEISDELLKKIEAGREILDHTETTLNKAQNNGINVSVVAGYNLQVLPITSSLTEQSDGLQATRYSGIGATTGDIKGRVKLSKQCKNGNHNHVEPGRAVDASSCFLPENTWFIKNHQHMDFASESAAAFLVWLVCSDTQRTVWQNTSYPQYLSKSVLGNKVSAFSDPSDSEINDYIYGDLDVNGKINAADARLALRYAVGLEGEPSNIMRLIGDVNGSGLIDAADARLILRYSVGLEDGFSAL
ncbi:MAG: dockerin type I repeat-containing protein [Oscillospiraceae bacterium]|nr:dockerin type I repeat-containing protein [Oscillospiraceae bacterium]